ncbi:MAG: hypothetical protein GX121_04145 [Ignavibacteria bacterium]|jgi:hypothetical protein|nr:hypothetical protein [Ignavibacteria bacterium]
MKVSPINIYKSNYLYGTEYSNSIKSNNIEKLSRENDKQDKLTVSNHNELITKKERQFFIKLFPESSEQIQNHVLFNRNGKVQNYNLTKGSLLDSRV